MANTHRKGHNGGPRDYSSLGPSNLQKYQNPNRLNWFDTLDMWRLALRDPQLITRQQDRGISNLGKLTANISSYNPVKTLKSLICENRS